jgi:HJR/Mrr/RecB family endonuclease
VARRRRSKRTGSGIGLTLFLVAVVVVVLRDHWPWLVGAAAVLVGAWIWWFLARRGVAVGLAEIDAMSGAEFERYLVRLFRELGFGARHVGGGGGDFGADLIIEQGTLKIAVQAKNYESGRVGNDAVQQAIAGATYYGCQQAMVVTNSSFTRAAREQAARSTLPVVLWGRKQLAQAIGGRLP